MKDRELWLAAIASLIIVAVTAAHYLRWLGKGKVRMTSVSDRGEERSFGRPLLLGMATALLVVNVAAHF